MGSTFHHDRTITAEAITTIKMHPNSINHWLLHSLLIVIVELEIFLEHFNVNALCYMCTLFSEALLGLLNPINKDV